MLTIDGSAGEGGGQILRTSLALSLLTGTPFRAEKIRAGREKSGLLRQHLTAVKAAAEIGGADVSGAELGSQELVFRPGRVRPGEYRFAIGSAGSACLVVQTVLLPLVMADGPSVLIVEGATHNPAAPPWDYLARVFFPLLGRMGARVTTTLERHGFFPAGGGRVRVEIEPVHALTPLSLLDRGEIVERRARALIAHIPSTVGERELHTLKGRLTGLENAVEMIEVRDSSGPGNALMVELTCEHVTEIFTGFGERGVRAEAIAEGVVREVRRYLAAGVPVGPHLADQLILPVALAGEGAIRTLPLTRHSQTNLEVAQRFIPFRATCSDDDQGGVLLEIAR